MISSDHPVSGPNPLSGRKRFLPKRLSEFQFAPYLFLVPTMGLLFLFSVFPMIYGIWMSLQNVDVVRGTSRFIGLGNYLQLFHDAQFGLSVLNTAWYTLTVVPLIVDGR